VPVLVDDGDVHIESNDIISYLEKKFPEPRPIPAATKMKSPDSCARLTTIILWHLGARVTPFVTKKAALAQAYSQGAGDGRPRVQPN